CVIRSVQNLTHLWDKLSDQPLDPLSQGDVRGAATLAAAPHSNEDVVVLNVEQLYKPAVHSNARVDVLIQNILHAAAHFLGREPVAFRNLRRRVQEIAYGGTYPFPELPPVFSSRLRDSNRVAVHFNL